MPRVTALKEDPPESLQRQELGSAVVRFAGDSGDGMQFIGSQFTQSTALCSNDLATFPDFPAEIRAPAGTTFGVSAFQINFGATVIKTSGDDCDMVVVMNPAALKVVLPELKLAGLILVDSGTFTERNLHKAHYHTNPLEDGSLTPYRLIELDISAMTLEAVKEFGLGKKEALRCKNMWTLGLVYWMYDRDRQVTIDWLNVKFTNLPDLVAANIAALNAGHAFGETAEIPDGVHGFSIGKADIAPGEYRTVTGAEALSWGLVAGAKLAGLKMTFCSYPITPASSLLHTLCNLIRCCHVPGRRRNRSRLHSHRRVLCRLVGGHVQLRPRDRAKSRSYRSCHQRRIATNRGQFATRRSLDRDADEDRTIRPSPGGVRTQRRQPVGGGRLSIAV